MDKVYICKYRYVTVTFVVLGISPVTVAKYGNSFLPFNYSRPLIYHASFFVDHVMSTRDPSAACNRKSLPDTET